MKLAEYAGYDALGLAEHAPYRGVSLTPAGEQVALEVIRHHRLLELYLAEHLGVPWDRVHEEAEALEHVISEDLEARIAAKLGNPTHDPHGDPIPSADLTIDEERCTQLPGYREAAVVRHFDAPEALDTRFYEVRAKSALNRVPNASRMPFRWSVSTRRLRYPP